MNIYVLNTTIFQNNYKFTNNTFTTVDKNLMIEIANEKLEDSFTEYIDIFVWRDNVVIDDYCSYQGNTISTEDLL